MPRPSNALIVDDEAHVRLFIRLLLKQLRIETVWEAADGTEALEQVAYHRPELVLLDINMPEMNGLDVLARIAHDYPGTPVIMVSSQNAMKTVLECRQMGAIAYVLKYAPRMEALKVIREALDSLGEDDSEGDAGPVDDQDPDDDEEDGLDNAGL